MLDEDTIVVGNTVAKAAPVCNAQAASAQLAAALSAEVNGTVARRVGTAKLQDLVQRAANAVGNAVRAGANANTTGSVPSETVALARSGFEALTVSLASSQQDAAAIQGLKELDAQLAQLQHNPDDLDFAQYARFEMRLVRLLPLPLLQRRTWEIRERFRVIFGEDRFRAYLDSKPPEPTAENREMLIADLQMLMKCISEAYVFALGRERVIQQIKRYIFRWSAAAGLTGLSVWVWLLMDSSGYHMIPLVALFGVFGATVSIFRRLQMLTATNASALDPALELMSLRLGAIGVVVALLSGWVFALLVGFMLQAQFVDLGGLAPSFAEGAILRPASWADGAKLLVFAFAAGFAERLMPDMIDHLAEKAARE